MYIVIEGIKGVGKSSLLKAIMQNLQHSNQKFEIICPTLRTVEFHQSINNILSYAELSNHHAKQINWNSSLILGDRSIFTSLAVHLDSNLSIDHCWKTIRKLEYEIGIPDVVIQIVCNESVLMNRYQMRQRDYGLEEENIESIRRLTKNYKQTKEWIKRNSHTYFNKNISWYTLDSTNNTTDKLLIDALNIIYQETTQHQTSN